MISYFKSNDFKEMLYHLKHMINFFLAFSLLASIILIVLILGS